MKARLGLAGILVLGMVTLASAAMGDEKGKKAAKSGPPDEKAMMEAMTKAGAPGEAHKKLEALVGRFSATVKTWSNP